MFSIIENAPSQAYVATLIAQDPDQGRNGKVQFRLSEKDHNLAQKFKIALTGEITAREKLNREEKAFYNLLVEAFDDGTFYLYLEIASSKEHPFYLIRNFQKLLRILYFLSQWKISIQRVVSI